MEYKQVCYSIETAENCGEKRNPYEVMKSLGFKIVASVPQTLYNTVWFTVEDYVENPPEFITKMWYNFDYWHNDCYKNCEYFKKDNTCCCGGEDCQKSQRS